MSESRLLGEGREGGENVSSDAGRREVFSSLFSLFGSKGKGSSLLSLGDDGGSAKVTVENNPVGKSLNRREFCLTSTKSALRRLVLSSFPSLLSSCNIGERGYDTYSIIADESGFRISLSSGKPISKDKEKLINIILRAYPGGRMTSIVDAYLEQIEPFVKNISSRDDWDRFLGEVQEKYSHISVASNDRSAFVFTNLGYGVGGETSEGNLGLMWVDYENGAEIDEDTHGLSLPTQRFIGEKEEVVYSAFLNLASPKIRNNPLHRRAVIFQEILHSLISSHSRLASRLSLLQQEVLGEIPSLFYEDYIVESIIPAMTPALINNVLAEYEKRGFQKLVAYVKGHSVDSYSLQFLCYIIAFNDTGMIDDDGTIVFDTEKKEEFIAFYVSIAMNMIDI